MSLLPLFPVVQKSKFSSIFTGHILANLHQLPGKSEAKDGAKFNADVVFFSSV